MKKMIPDQTLIIITVAATASQVIAAVTMSLFLPPPAGSPRLGNAETSCAILASAIPPIKLARTIPCETALSERMSITHVPALPAYRRTSPIRSTVGQQARGDKPAPVVTSYWENERNGWLGHTIAWMSAPSRR